MSNNEACILAVAEISFMMKGFLKFPEPKTAIDIVETLNTLLEAENSLNSVREDVAGIITGLEDYVNTSENSDLIFGFFILLLTVSDLYINEQCDTETALDYLEKAGNLFAPMLSLVDGEKELIENVCAMFCDLGNRCKQLNTERALISGDKIIYEAEKIMS